MRASGFAARRRGMRTRRFRGSLQDLRACPVRSRKCQNRRAGTVASPHAPFGGPPWPIGGASCSVTVDVEQSPVAHAFRAGCAVRAGSSGSGQDHADAAGKAAPVGAHSTMRIAGDMSDPTWRTTPSIFWIRSMTGQARPSHSSPSSRNADRNALAALHTGNEVCTCAQGGVSRTGFGQLDFKSWHPVQYRGTVARAGCLSKTPRDGGLDRRLRSSDRLFWCLAPRQDSNLRPTD